jgi:chromosomal replication initiator protein
MLAYVRPGLFTPEEIIASHWDITVDQMRQKGRDGHITQARQVAMWYYHEFKHYGKTFIGRKFNRDHATVWHSVRAVNNQMDVDRAFRSKVENIVEACKNLPGNGMCIKK